MNKINIVYLKELGNLDEIFEKDSKLPIILKTIILFLKKIFCIITINEEKVYILPYSNLERFSKIKLILLTKLLQKINGRVVLSNYLNENKKLKKMLQSANVIIIEGMLLSTYLLPEIIEYICNKMKIEKQKQEITILTKNKNIGFRDLAIELAKTVKRIHIVTNRVMQFENIERDLEGILGVGCQITNNKRKSLLKSKIVINLDYLEDELNEFTINPNAIIIDVIQKVNINTKLFCGIHIYDYEIGTDTQIEHKEFEKKKVLEAKIFGKNYSGVRESIKEENIIIEKLYGKNGEINALEYENIAKKLLQNT